jgi:cystathionine beta-lyase/cystathionine gamma-synthase
MSTSAPSPTSFDQDLFTLAVHADAATSDVTTSRALCPPIAQSVTFARDSLDQAGGHAYSRVSNPTVDALERALGALERAPHAVCFDSGLSAELTLFLALLSQGDHVVLSRVVYGGTTRLVRQVLARFGVSATFVECTDLDALRAAISPATKLVFVETPANPTLDLLDIAAVAGVTRAARVPLCVDNTFLTAALQRPLELGADLSLYSTTKYIEGHNGALGGAIVSHDAALLDRLRFHRKCFGTIQSPLNAYLTLRGIKTLPLRLERASRSAQWVAESLSSNPAVERVFYPGLDSFPQRELAERQHRGAHGGVIAFEVRGGLDAARRVASSLRLCTLAENLGATETLVTHSASMTHADVPREQRIASGITDGLIRVSLGLEDPRDVLADLEAALSTLAVSRSPIAREVLGV